MTGRGLLMGCVMSCALAVPTAMWAEKPVVQVAPPNLQGSRPVEKQTEQSVIRDYLQSWQSLRSAMQQNRPALLNPDFVGTALDKLTDTIHEQAKLGIQTRYQDRSHHLQIVFYSPEGLSIEMMDTVEYGQQVLSQGKVLTTQQVQARYIVVMTPAASRWQVRILQALPN